MSSTTQADRVREFLQGVGDYLDFQLGWPPLGLPRSVHIETQSDADTLIPGIITKSDSRPRVIWAELTGYVDFTPWLAKIDWLILSGSATEPTDLDDLRRVIADCREAGVKVWVRSLGARPFDAPNHAFDRTNEAWSVLPSEWPAWANVREVPACLEGE